MKMLGIYNSTNKRFRKDGDEFAREAEEWKVVNTDYITDYIDGANDSCSIVDIRDGAIIPKIRAEIRKMTNGLDVLAIFDHGTPKGLPRMRENLGNVKGLAATIAKVTKRITIILYACSCGRGWWRSPWKNKRNVYTLAGSCDPKDGYAMSLCCELVKLGVDSEVYAHLTAGHTTRNPNIVGISGFAGDRGSDLAKKVWRTWVVSPQDSWWKQWKKSLKGPRRFTFWR